MKILYVNRNRLNLSQNLHYNDIISYLLDNNINILLINDIKGDIISYLRKNENDDIRFNVMKFFSWDIAILAYLIAILKL